MDQQPSSQIFVKNLPSNIDHDELKNKFEKFGEIKNITLKTGFCFIRYFNDYCAKDAIENMNDKTIGDNKITVKFAIDNPNNNDFRHPKKTPSATDRCNNCQELGHWAFQCPQKKER